jgi:ABC-type uncharacterized transport system fused permease/ATPase subunit
VFFIPQLPYVFKGTLVENLAYPFFFLYDSRTSDSTLRPPTRIGEGFGGGDEEMPLHARRRPSCWPSRLRRRGRSLLSPYKQRGGRIKEEAEEEVLNTKGIGWESVRKALEMAGLELLCQRYGQETLFTRRQEWDSVLSPGEQQRLNFARLFLCLLLLTSSQVGLFTRPLFAVLDEATSFMDEAMERRIYRQCQQEGVTLISVGHRSSLRAYHHILLLLHPTSVDQQQRHWPDSEDQSTDTHGRAWTLSPLPNAFGDEV